MVFCLVFDGLDPTRVSAEAEFNIEVGNISVLVYAAIKFDACRVCGILDFRKMSETLGAQRNYIKRAAAQHTRIGAADGA